MDQKPLLFNDNDKKSTNKKTTGTNGLNQKNNIILLQSKGEEETKYQDPITGAHFKYEEMCIRLEYLKKQLIGNEDMSAPIKTEDSESILESNFAKKTQQTIPIKIKQQSSLRNLLQIKKDSGFFKVISNKHPENLKRQASCSSNDKNSNLTKSARLFK